MTYNIHRAIGLDRRFRLDRIATILRHHRPDVALLQEVDQGAPRSSRLDLARELAERVGYPHYAVGHNVELRRGRYGNATLCRWPIVARENIDLTVPRRKRRGCQHTRVEVTGERHTFPLDIFNLHLGLSAQERARQIGRLVRAAGLDRPGGPPCVVAGDFNDWRSLLHPVLTEILSYRSATHLHAGTQPGLRTFPSFSPRGSLDRIYFRGPLSLLEARTCDLRVSRVASDHLPVIADFRGRMA